MIGLANDETGIPETPEKRLECARKIVGAANDHGIATEDVLIDPLAMAAGLTSAVMSTAEVCVESVRASDLLLGHDAWGASWNASPSAALFRHLG